MGEATADAGCRSGRPNRPRPPRRCRPQGVTLLLFLPLINLLVLLCTTAAAAAAAARLLGRRRDRADPPKYLVDKAGTTTGGFVTTGGDPKGTGVPVGDKHTYPYGADCYNANAIILEARADAKQGPITYRQAWDELELCHIATKDESLVVAKNAEKWHEACEKVFGEICRRQCYQLSALFDRMDYTRYPPSAEEGGADYYLQEDDCENCLLNNECDQPPRTTFSARIPRPFYGNREGVGVLLPKKAILIAGQTTRAKPLGK